MTEIVLLLAAAAAAFAVAKALRLPFIPLLMLSGAVLAAIAPVTRAFLEDALVLGLTFLVFVAGIELNPQRVGAQRRAALRVGLVQFVLLGAAGFVLALALGFDPQTAVYLALALTASSTLVVVQLLMRRKQLFEPFGRLVIGVLLIQDLLIILLIPVVTLMPLGVAAVAVGVVGTLALLGLALLCMTWVMPFLLLRLRLDEEGILLAVLAVLFVFVGMADALRLPLVAGAFLAGFSLSAFPLSGVVRGQLNSLADFFLAIFFTALGGFLILPTVVELTQALVLAVAVIVITPPLVTWVGERAGLSARPAIESGLLLSQTSEFSIIVGLQGVVLGQIGADVFTVIALVTITTMVLTPFIATDRVTWSLMRIHPVRSRITVPRPPEGYILLLGCGETGLPLLETLVASGHEVLVIDDDPAIIERLREGDIPCVRGDASDLTVLRSAGARKAALVISTIRRPRDNEAVLRYLRGRPVLVRVFDVEDANRIRELGGTPVLYSEAAAEDFLQDYDEGRLLAGRSQSGSTGTGGPVSPNR